MKQVYMIERQDQKYKGVILGTSDEVSSLTSATVTFDDGTTAIMADQSVAMCADDGGTRVLYDGEWL